MALSARKKQKRGRGVKAKVVSVQTSGSSGGKAEASGGNYETLVTTWYAHCVLLGTAAHPPFDLPASTQLVSVISQSDAPVDDVNAATSDGGIIFVQAKRSVSLSLARDSGFASALDQFVQQHKASSEGNRSVVWGRPLNSDLDRLVLATRSSSSSKLTEILPRLLRGLRDRADVHSLRQVATSLVENNVASVTEKNLKRSWKAAHGRSPTPEQLGALMRLIWVQELDLESGGRDRKGILEQFRINLLQDPTQAGSAFSEVFRLAARLRADRSGSDRNNLLRMLAVAGTGSLPLRIAWQSKKRY